ncbi:Zinc finger protein [Schistosoma haematobium]|uniref:Zinc finger protein n=1 Tax=Schistosoma haematobium TaxID=6185 RepID=A0A922LKA3_SCHHA|nr:Zinc finger protein [Schistosoma haematobium]KAH9587788.1 Zinc finger protein [Schistosoma haematobium]
MPKKKTGQRKKAEKAKIRQKLLRKKGLEIDLINHPSNILMECGQCGKHQKNRAFCYFCQSIQRLPVCCHCGKQKCSARSGDCLVKHGSTHVTGLSMVVSVVSGLDGPSLTSGSQIRMKLHFLPAYFNTSNPSRPCLKTLHLYLNLITEMHQGSL